MADDRPIISERAPATVVENRIRATIEAGEFDNLPGLGQPAAIFDEPYDPHWWVRRKPQQEDMSSLQLRKDRGFLPSGIDSHGNGIVL